MSDTQKKINVSDEIESTIAAILQKLTVEATIKVEKDSADNLKVSINTNETGLLIGHHGETLNSLQLLTGVILYKKLGNWVRVVLDVGDYRKVREENIKEMVERIVEEVESTGKPVILPYLTPFERRFVHLMVSSNPKVYSESDGLGRDRRITIKPK